MTHCDLEPRVEKVYYFHSSDEFRGAYTVLEKSFAAGQASGKGSTEALPKTPILKISSEHKLDH